MYIAGVLCAFCLNTPLLAQSVVFAGLTHDPLGPARLRVDASNHLIVSNIGSSGLDGVRVELGESEFWEAALARFDRAAPLGASLSVKATAATVAGPVVAAAVGLVKNAADVGVSVAFPFLGSPVLRVAVLDDAGRIVASGNITAGPVAAFVETADYDIVLPFQSPLTPSPGIGIAIQFPTPTDITITGEPTASGTTLIVSASGSEAPGPLVSASLTGTNVGTATINGERLGVFGLAHRALGQATLRAAGVCPSCTLTLGNIGSSGDDGVSVDIEPSDGFDIRWRPIDPTPLPIGASVRNSVSGSVGGAQTETIGAVRTENIGASLEVSADFSQIGSLSTTVEVYDGGVLVGAVVGVTSPIVATLDARDWPTGFAARANFPGPAAFGLALRFDAAPVAINLIGGGTFVGDELRLQPENPSGPTDFLSTNNDQHSDIPLLIVDAEDPDPPCPGDINDDNAVDLSDLATLLANFGTAAGASLEDGDLDQDGDVDLADLAGMLAEFGNLCG